LSATPVSTRRGSLVNWARKMLIRESSNGLGDHLKTGHRGSLQNRPTELTQDKLIYTLFSGRWQ
jgi:hypothetical protein